MDTKGEDTKDDEEGGDEGRVSPILITVCKVLAKVIGKYNMVSLSPTVRIATLCLLQLSSVSYLSVCL